MQATNILYTSENRQAYRIARVAHRHPILRAQIHTWHLDDVKNLIWMLLVVPLDCLLQLRQRTQVRVALQLLLAFSAGKNYLALPWSGVGFLSMSHVSGLDAATKGQV